MLWLRNVQRLWQEHRFYWERLANHEILRPLQINSDEREENLEQNPAVPLAWANQGFPAHHLYAEIDRD